LPDLFCQFGVLTLEVFGWQRATGPRCPPCSRRKLADKLAADAGAPLGHHRELASERVNSLAASIVRPDDPVVPGRQVTQCMVA